MKGIKGRVRVVKKENTRLEERVVGLDTGGGSGLKSEVEAMRNDMEEMRRALVKLGVRE